MKAQIRLVFILLMILAVAPCARAATTDLLLARPAGMQAQANGGKVMHAMSLNPNAFNMAPGSSATLSIPGRAAYQIVFERIEFHASGNRTWVGFLKDHGDDFRVFLTTGVGGSSGSINTPDGQYRFDAVDADGWLLDIKASGLVPPVSASPDYLLPAGEPLAAAALQHAAAAPPATSSVIDLLVLYPVSMTTRYGSQLQSRLDTLVTLTNQAFTDSGVNATLRLVRSEQLANFDDTANNATTLNDITAAESPSGTTVNPVYAGVPALRNQYGADLVMLWRPFSPSPAGESCGVAWVIGANAAPAGGYGTLAYSVVNDGADTGGSAFFCNDATFAHELGHNMGAMHDRLTIGKSWSGNGAFPAGAYAYSYGYGVSNQFITIMAYANYGVAPQSGKFSNPAVLCVGLPCGVSELDATNGANNALTFNNSRSLIAAFRASASTAVTPATGYWWNPAEPGRGFNIEKSGNNLFMASFLYDASGRTNWYGVGPGAMSGNSYTSVLAAYAGGQTLTGAYKSPTVVGPSGAFSITFASPTQASITWPGGTIPIQRFDFGPGGSTGTQAAGTPQSGWWWNPGEGGRGFAIEVQGGTMFLAGYMYDEQGSPVWYASGPTAMVSTSLYQGAWAQFANGQTLTGAFKASSVINANVGAITIQFTSSSAGTMTLPDGRQIPLQRYTF